MNEHPTGKTYVGSDELYADVQRCMKLVAEMNTGYHTEAEVRDYLRQITASEVDNTVRVFPPFNINYGKKDDLRQGQLRQLRVHLSCPRRHHYRGRCIHRTALRVGHGVPPRGP